MSKGNLKEVSPKLYNEFSVDVNVGVDRDSINTINNRNYYWWVCEYGHHWHARIDKRLKGAGCVPCWHKKLKGR